MYNTFDERVKAAFLKERGLEKEAPVQTAIPFGEAIRKAVPDSYSREVILKKTLLPIYKALGTVDIAALRLVSVSDRTPVKRNEETRWLNFLESQDNFPPVLDYQYRIKERDIVTDDADIFNVDAALPPNAQSAYRQRFNTLTAIGNTLQVSFMASAIAEQQADVNILEEQIDDQVVRIRRTMNSIMLANVEQTSESTSAVPQMGGIITRSTLNNISASSGNLTNALIQEGVDDIGLVLGYDKQLLLFCTPGQVGVVDDLTINRYPGENSAAYFSSLQTLIQKQLEKFQVPWSTVYRPRPGSPIPVIMDSKMPADTALLVAGRYPRMARFKMEGMVGPFVLARPEQTLYELVLCFDIATLDDPLIESRAVFTNLAS